MIGTIRKHSKWLWWIIAALTVISFLYWGASVPTRNGGGVIGDNGYGSLYGHKITQQEYINARNEFFLFYWFRNHEWPDRNPNIKDKDLESQIYLRLMLAKKAESLGISVSDQAAAAVANSLLLSLGSNGRPYPIQEFVTKHLAQKGLTADDFERFSRDDAAIEQLLQTLGLTGTFITPQEAAAAYQRDHQQVSAQIVFFSASNYVSQTAVTPATVGQFYSNYLAQYRLPDRVQVSYVEFNLSNYLEQARAKLAKTNLDAIVDSNYRQLGPDYFPDAKTPEAAKAKIREMVFQQEAMTDAKAQANAFATTLFSLMPKENEPKKPNLLADVAKQKGLTVRLTTPFASHQYFGPDEFVPPDTFIKAAFALTAEDPLAGPIIGSYAYYVMALVKQLPTEIPALDQIRDRVTQDFRTMQATIIAQRTGTNFASGLASQLMAGHGFASACIAAGLHLEVLPQFSLSTQELPELGGRATITQLKQATFSTPAGQASGFEETEDGGFIVYVQSRLPVDPSAISADLPQYTAGLRRQRQGEAFDQWIQTEANRQFRNIPFFQQTGVPGAK